MRILLAVHGYPPEMRGGTEHAVEALAGGLVRAGHDVAVVAGTQAPGAAWPPLRSRQPVAGTSASIQVLRLRRDGLFVGHWQRYRDDAVGEAFERVLRDVRPDVLHVHHWLRLSRDLVARAARHGVPAVVTLHDAWTNCLAYFRVRPDTLRSCDEPLGPAACLDCVGHHPHGDRRGATSDLALHVSEMTRELRLARAVFTLCTEQIPRLRRALAPGLDDVDIVALPPARDLSLAPAPRIPPPAALGRLVLGSWGAYFPLKGQALLLDALERLLARGVRTELHLAGSDADPAYAAQIRRRAAALAPHAVAHGSFHEGGLGRHPVARVHAFVSGSIVRETWGFVLDEALALGLPVVVPRWGAFPEHVPEGRGAIHYAPGDASDLAGKLESLARDPAALERLAAEVPPLVEVLPPVEAHTARVVTAYRAAVARGAPPAPLDAPEAAARRAARFQAFLQAVRPEAGPQVSGTG